MLDDLSMIKKVDIHNMLSCIESLPEQLTESRELAKSLGALVKPKSIVVQGMGGSGIMGDILHDWLSKKIKIPIIINKNLALPEIDNDAMLIATSYSGNTRETLLALDEGLDKTRNVLCITSGGELLDLCLEKGLAHVKVPADYPPRCALGYLLGSAVYALKKASIYDGEDEMDETGSHLKWLRDLLAPKQEPSANPAKRLALELKNHIPVIYAYDEFYSCAKRWQTCLNENAKVLSWCGALPEMSHNEIEGWGVDDRVENFAMVFLRDKDEPEDIKNKIEAIKSRTKCKLLEVWSEGKGRLSRMFHLMYVGDFVSYYLAILRGIDPMLVEAIEELKKEGA